MALLVVHRDIWGDDFYRTLLQHTFSSISVMERYADRLVIRVWHEELPDDNTIIEPYFIQFDGVYPFVLDWGINKQQ